MPSQAHEDVPEEPEAPSREPKAADAKPPSSLTKKKFKAPLYVAPQSLDLAQPLQATELQSMAIQLEDACKPGGHIASSSLLQFGKNLEIKLSKTLPEDRLGIVLNFMSACRKADVQNPELRRRTWTLVQGCMKDLARHSTQKMEPFFRSPDALMFALGGADDDICAVEKQLIRQQVFLWVQQYMQTPPRRSDHLYPTIKNIFRDMAPHLTAVQQTLLKAAPTPTCLRELRYALAGKKPDPSISNCLLELVHAWPAGMRAVHRVVSGLDPDATGQWLDSAPDLRLAVNKLTAQHP